MVGIVQAVGFMAAAVGERNTGASNGCRDDNPKSRKPALWIQDDKCRGRKQCYAASLFRNLARPVIS